MEKIYLVYLDSQVYIRQKLNYDSKWLKVIKAFVDDGSVKILMHEITRREVTRHFRRKIYEVDEKASYLGKGIGPAIGVDVSDVMIEKANEYFDRFFSELKVIDIGGGEIDVSPVINDHFEQISPFSAKKPDEFRDALVLEYLKKYKRKLEPWEEIIFISGDKDYEDIEIEKIKFVKSIKDLLDSIRQPSAFSIEEYLNELKELLHTELSDRQELFDYHSGIPVEDFILKDVEITGHQIFTEEGQSADINFNIIIEGKFNLDETSIGPDEDWSDYENNKKYETEVIARVSLDSGINVDILEQDIDIKVESRNTDNQIGEQYNIVNDIKDIIGPKPLELYESINFEIASQVVLDWQEKEDVLRGMRRSIKRILRGYNISNIDEKTKMIMDVFKER